MSHAKGVSQTQIHLPEGLHSDRAKLIYLYLHANDGTELETIASDLGLPMITLCDLLRTLEDSGHVRRTGDAYRCA